MTISVDINTADKATMTMDQTVAPRISPASADDYYRLLKPRVMSLVIFTALVGMMYAPTPINPVLGFAALLAIAIGAGASGCLNMWYDADVDSLMTRTATRPIPAGRVLPNEALGFGMSLSVGSVVFLGLITNWQSAAFLAFTIFFYAVIYTIWLKRATPQNIVIGGAAGAFPPMIGYMAATGSVDLSVVLLFAIIFIWTPPHFWALALVKSGDYSAAGVPMLPVVRGAAHTRLQILLYTIVLVPVAIAPSFMGFGGIAYFIVSTVTGAAMLALAVKIYRVGDGEEANKAAMQMFGFSILYLLLLFAVMLAEQSFGFGAGMTQALSAVFGGGV